MELVCTVVLIWDTSNVSVIAVLPLYPLQVVFGASEELLPHSLCGVHGHRGPPGSLPPGVQKTKHDTVL